MSDSLGKVPDLAPGQIHRVEQTIKRSRFITSVARTASPEQAREFIAQIREEFQDARHNCWAFNAGPAQSTAQIGASDDGEPHGTAGRPMLTVLTHSGVGEITAVVTRYFGGILLGTGGLVKAYQSSVKQALETLPLAELTEQASLAFTVEHRFVTPVLRLLASVGAKVLKQDFGMDATFTVSVPKSELASVQAQLVELTGGALLFED